MKVIVHCDWCGAELIRDPSHIHRHNFCDKLCMSLFSDRQMNPDGYSELKDYSAMSANMTRINEILNPHRMTPEIRKKLRDKRIGDCQCKAYAKYYGRAEHRVVAERVLGRKLLPGEVVHHIDGNKRNNSPENLMVLSSQSEHAKLHSQMRKGGGAQ